jgi:aminopeptidase N
MKAVCLCLFAAASSFTAAQQQSPFAPPRASLHYAPDRTFDLVNLEVFLDIDYAGKKFTGRSINTVKPLMSGGHEMVINAGDGLTIAAILLNGKAATYRRDGEDLHISTPPLVAGKAMTIETKYSGGGSRGRDGIHWIQPRTGQPDHVGFWTQGETMTNRDWAPTWDYPNDMTTSETHTTVPADWEVVGNGKLVSSTKVGDKRTCVWKMDQPHATYLLSLAAGPLTIKKDTWRGVDVLYVVPKSRAALIDGSFGDTKDMLSYYSNILGVKYAWPKYAEDAMYEFGGGMENVSATTLQESALTEPREGYFNMASLNAHELAHQWFGDLVTCKDWAHIWLNEAFATFMENLYMGHSRGKNAYDQSIEGDIQGYLQEARRYKRPIVTYMYPNADAMFDSHTYPKGAAVLHTLRRKLGDAAFFKGLNLYLTTYRHQPVVTPLLIRSLTQASGVDCQGFFDQWVYKPGHPVLDYSWTWDAGKHAAEVTVKQTQDTSDGTPVYSIDGEIGVISGGQLRRFPAKLRTTEDKFTIALTSKPDALLVDPDHDFLREIPKLNWDRSEVAAIFEFAPNSVDRTEAMRRMLTSSPTDQEVAMAVRVLRADAGMFPAITSIAPLGDLKRADLRGFFTEQLSHKSFDRRSQAINALAKLPQDAATTQKLRSLINKDAPVSVVVASIRALAAWDKAGNADVFRKALTIPSLRDRIKTEAQRALG